MNRITTILMLGLALSTNLGAQQYIVAGTPEAALKACEEKAAASPKALHRQMLDYCNCVVKKTDFKEVARLNATGETQALQKLYQAAEKACD